MEDEEETKLGDTINIDFGLNDFRTLDFHAVKLHLTNFPDLLLPMHKVSCFKAKKRVFWHQQ